MKAIFIILFFSLGLTAQSSHYERGTFVTQVADQFRIVGGIQHLDRQLQLQEARGQVHRIAPPPDLGRNRGYMENLGHWEGTGYALVVLSHPLFSRLGDSWNPKDHTNRRDYLPRVLYRIRNGGTWERISTHHRDPYCQFMSFMPLEDGRFLVDRAIRSFEKDGANSPFAIYGVDGQGRLILDSLVPVDPASRDWVLARTTSGITLLHRSTGKWLLLSNRNGQVITRGELWPTEKISPPTFRKILHAAPRPDGRLLLATEDVPVDHPASPGQKLELFRKGRHLGSTESLVVEQLRWKLREGPIAPLSARWWLMKPETGRLHELQPPRNFPVLATSMARFGFRFAVRPDGNLSFETRIPEVLPNRPILAWSPLPILQFRRLLLPRRKPESK